MTDAALRATADVPIWSSVPPSWDTVRAQRVRVNAS